MKENRIKEKRTIYWSEEILYGILDIVIIFYLYKISMFISIRNTTPNFSKGILAICLVASYIIRGILRAKASKNNIRTNTKGSAIIGAGIYTVLAYYEYYAKWFLIVLMIFAATSIGGCILVLTQKIRGKRLAEIEDPMRRQYIIRKRAGKMLRIVDVCLYTAIVLVVIPVGYNQQMNNGIMKAKTLDIREANGDAWELFETNIDVIEKIRENARWKPLTISEKLCTLQAIADCAVEDLGIPAPVTVVLADFEMDNLLGDYDHAERIIRISRDHLETDDADECLNTILHEVYHCYERSLMDLYIELPEQAQSLYLFRDCRQYIEETRNYVGGIDSDEGIIEYYNQQVEEDCRTYAENMVHVYYETIDGLQGNGEKYRGEILD